MLDSTSDGVDRLLKMANQHLWGGTPILTAQKRDSQVFMDGTIDGGTFIELFLIILPTDSMNGKHKLMKNRLLMSQWHLSKSRLLRMNRSLVHIAFVDKNSASCLFSKSKYVDNGTMNHIRSVRMFEPMQREIKMRPAFLLWQANDKLKFLYPANKATLMRRIATKQEKS